jgi:hypothetical protein
LDDGCNAVVHGGDVIMFILTQKVTPTCVRNIGNRENPPFLHIFLLKIIIDDGFDL